MDIVAEMRGFEIDHEPEGWPAVRVIRALSLSMVGGSSSLRIKSQQPNPITKAELLHLIRAFAPS